MRLAVPYVKQQTRWSCAVASLEMVAGFHGVAIDQAATYERLKRPVPGQKGHWCVWNHDLIVEIKSLGLEVEELQVNYTNCADMMATIRSHIDANEPIIAAQRTAMTSPFGHSRVIVGYDAPPTGESIERVVFHDPGAFPQQGVSPGGPTRVWKADIFANMWKPNGSVAGGAALRIWKKP